MSYSDGKTISSQDATPFSITRREDVQVIIQPSDEHNWVTLTGTDYYVWDDRGKGAKWWGVNDRSGLDWYFRKPGYKCVLFGTWIETEDFRRIFNQARERWGNKEVFANDERKPEFDLEVPVYVPSDVKDGQVLSIRYREDDSIEMELDP